MDVEKKIHLRAICHIELRGRLIGAYLLEKNRRFLLRFGFVTSGVHPFIGLQKCASTLESWSEGLIGIPRAEVLRIHQKSLPEVTERWFDLETRADTNQFEPLQLLNYVEQRHIGELSQQGDRSLYQTHLFATYTHQPGASAEQDLLERMFARLAVPFSDAYRTLKGVKSQEDKELLAEVITNGVERVFLKVEQQLNSRMALKTAPMQSQELMAYAWGEFNATESRPIPHLIVAKEVEGHLQIEEQIDSGLSLSSLLVRGSQGLPSVPQTLPGCFKIKDQYVAAMVLEERISGYTGSQHQFEFFWRPFLKVHNCEVVWEGQLSNSVLDSIELQRSLRYHKQKSKLDDQHVTLNIAAGQEVEDILETQRKILENKRSLIVSVVYFLYRDSRRELDSACHDLASQFPEGMLIRELVNPLELWLNKQPFVWEKLVGQMRRHDYMSDQISLPVVCPKSFDRRGMEFITKEGGKPVYYDTVTRHHNSLTVARTRRGKSTKEAALIFTSLSHKIPHLVLDYGMADGRTTYSDMVDFLGKEVGASVEVATTQYNLLQTPNLERFSSEEQRKKNEASHQGFILQALQTPVLGDEHGTRFAKRCRSFLDYLIAEFYADPVIAARFQAGHRKGMGSLEWEDMPVLPEFIELAKTIDLERVGGDAVASEARNEVVFALTTFLRSPFGQSLSRPSRVRLDVPFLNFSLRGARNEEETTLAGAVAQSIAGTRALEFPQTNLTVDEGSLLFEKKALVLNTAEMVINGGKSGICVSLLTQDLPTVANCVAGPKFMTNTDVKFIGSVDEGDINDLAHYLNKPHEVFLRNAQEDFNPDPVKLCSHWLMLVEGTRLYLSHFPSPELMALVASNPQEQRIRQRYFEAYADPLEAVNAFSLDYVKARRSGMSMENLIPEPERLKARPIYAA